MYSSALESQLGLRTERIDVAAVPKGLPEIEQLILRSTADVVFVMTSFQEDREDLISTFRRLYERPSRPRLVYLDYFAQTSSPYFGVLPYVDRYVKRQLLKDRSLYSREFDGGYIFTDFFRKQYDYDLNGWHFGSIVPDEYAHRLVLGWNLAVTKEYRWILRANRVLPKRWRKRKIDINSRISLGGKKPWEWYQEYRARSQQLIDGLNGRYRLSGKDRVNKRQFMRELRDSKIVFSPFGWGELCFRDYEAVIWGALLVKPSMEHLETHPDIFREGVSYVACAWDHHDFEEKCRRSLEDPDTSEQIVHQAQGMLWDYYERGGFVNDVRRVLDGL